MALTNLYINTIVKDSTDSEDAAKNIQSLYGVKTITCGGSQFIDGQSVIDALLAADVSTIPAGSLKAGAIVRLYDRYWILLENVGEPDQENIVALKLLSKDSIGKSVFGEVNNFGTASIGKCLNGVAAANPGAEWKLTYPGLNNIEISSLQKFNTSNNLTEETTVAQNGDTTYVLTWDRDKLGYVALMDETDYKKYYDTNGVLTKIGASVKEPYWLMTPTGCNGKRVVIAQPDGTLSSALCTTQCGVRPIIVAKVGKSETIQVAQLG